MLLRGFGKWQHCPTGSPSAEPGDRTGLGWGWRHRQHVTVTTEGHEDQDSEPTCALVWAYVPPELLRRGMASFPGPQFLHLENGMSVWSLRDCPEALPEAPAGLGPEPISPAWPWGALQETLRSLRVQDAPSVSPGERICGAPRESLLQLSVLGLPSQLSTSWRPPVLRLQSLASFCQGALPTPPLAGVPLAEPGRAGSSRPELP